MTTGLEYPKWIRHPGKDDVLVDNAAAEAQQLAEWGAEKPRPTPRNALLSPLDHDKDGKPGGSLAGAGDDIATLRSTYKDKVGKRAFPGWSAEVIRERLAKAS